MTNLEIKVEKFLMEDIQELAIPVLTESCELLDLIELIPDDNLAFYETVVSDLAGVHWNPNRNTKFHLGDIFNLTNYLAHFYDQVVIATSEYENCIEKPSNIPKFIKGVIEYLSDGKDELTNVKNKFEKSIIKRLLKQYIPIVDRYIVKINTAIKLVKSIDENILESHLVKKILREGDKSYGQRLLVNTTFSVLLKEFSKDITQMFNPILMKLYEYNPSLDLAEQPINQSEKECRKYVKGLFMLGNNKVIKEAVRKIITEMKSDSSVFESASEKTRFMTIHVTRSAYFSLIITLALTLVLEAKKLASDFCKAGHLPLLTNFHLTYDENHPDSTLFIGGNTSNSYVLESSNRFILSIHEATTETISAVNIQLALWVYIATMLIRVKAIFKDSFNFDMTNEMFGFEEDAFTDFYRFPMLLSLIGRIISLTFAQ